MIINIKYICVLAVLFINYYNMFPLSDDNDQYAITICFRYQTTTINMLTGLLAPDWTLGDQGAFIYGNSVLSDMEAIRLSMGVCPQHDVLFEQLSVREHILFFAQLKGASLEEAQEEATSLTELFHLDQRLDHLGNELSGGQRRKLSVAIAVCGGSKFVVLDEPTAGA